MWLGTEYYTPRPVEIAREPRQTNVTQNTAKIRANSARSHERGRKCIYIYMASFLIQGMLKHSSPPPGLGASNVYLVGENPDMIRPGIVGM